MFKTRSKLLIALVLFGVLGAAVGNAYAEVTRLAVSPGDASAKPAFQPGLTPNAGEPDVGNNSPPPRLSMTPGGRASEPSFRPESRTYASLADALRWTWVIWFARYLNPIP